MWKSGAVSAFIERNVSLITKVNDDMAVRLRLRYTMPFPLEKDCNYQKKLLELVLTRRIRKH